VMLQRKENRNNKYCALTLTALIMLFCSCSNHDNVLIEPISAEYNERFLTLQGLDQSMFSKKDVVQYYQVSNFRGLPRDTVLARLGAFTNLHYKFSNIDMDSVYTLNIFFYRKRLSANYSKNLYESARDNDNRTLEGYSGDLMAWISYERLKSNRLKIIRSLYLHSDKEHKLLELRDTLSL
jgi:hypothetical protein